jgi:acetoin utilization deacetylase AcuC-like enzyme
VKCGILYDTTFERHVTGHGHPEQIKRASFVFQKIKNAGLLENTQKIPVQKCTIQNLRLVHDLDYLQSSKKEIEDGFTSLSTGDTAICKESWDVATLATGGVINAVNQLFSGKINNAFCITRPPGHHANSNKGMGFCLFNHVAIAARYAQEKLGVGKILIVDWDVHHGNGTQDIFYEDDSVFFFSTHQSPWYPGTGSRTETGTGIGLGYNLNCPFSAGAGKKEIIDHAFGTQLTRKMINFKPEFVIISAGFDSRMNDPLGQFQLYDQDFYELTKIILDIAKEYANGRVISVLEGGYNLKGLASASISHLQAFLSKDE